MVAGINWECSACVPATICGRNSVHADGKQRWTHEEVLSGYCTLALLCLLGSVIRAAHIPGPYLGAKMRRKKAIMRQQKDLWKKPGRRQLSPYILTVFIIRDLGSKHLLENRCNWLLLERTYWTGLTSGCSSMPVPVLTWKKRDENLKMGKRLYLR